MFDSALLDTAFGLTFAYLSLSLLVTAALELAEAVLKRRASTLKRGIELLLGEKLTGEFYKHALIRTLYRDGGASDRARPSYIPARTFAVAVADLAVNAAKDGAAAVKSVEEALGKIEGDVGAALRALLRDVKGDAAEVHKRLEGWFNDSMDRVSGWYKRRTQWILLGLGIALAGLLNVDTLGLATALYRDEALRGALVASAEAARLGSEAEPLARALRQLEDPALPIGWNLEVERSDPRWFPRWDLGAWALKLFGFLLTGLAVSLGAPFWFDLLNKLSMVRSAVKPKEKPSPE